MRQGVRSRIIVIAVLLALTALIYSNTFSNSFHYDDERVILDNEAIKSLGNYGNIFEISSKEGSRPILDLTFAINYHFDKLNVFGYHLFNLIIHMAVCVLVYFIVSKMLLRTYIHQKECNDAALYKLVPIFTSILFAVHPINSQVVNYVSARSSSLCVLFILISLWFFIKLLDLFTEAGEEEDCLLKNNVKFFSFSFLYLSASIATFLLALGTKKMAIIIPLLLVCFDCYFYSRRHKHGNNNNLLKKHEGETNASSGCLYRLKLIIWKFRLYHIPYWAIIGIGVFKFTNSASANFSLYVPLHVNILTACKVYIYYIKLLFMPVGLSIDHYFPVVTTLSDIAGATSVCLVISLIILAVFLFKNKRIVSFSIALYFIAPIVTSSILIISYSSMTSLISEHRIYASTIGFCIAITMAVCIASKYISGLRFLSFKTSGDKLYYIQFCIMCPLIILYCITTVYRNFDWKDEYTLWAKAVEHHPMSFKAQYNLGEVYTKNKDWDASITHYLNASKLDFDDFQVHNNLGIAYKEKGDLELAINEFKISTALKENYSDARFNLAITLEESGDSDQAVNEYKKSLKLKPDNIIAMYNLGRIYLIRGDIDSAEHLFKDAVKIGEKNSFENLEMFEIYHKSSLNTIISEVKDHVVLKSLSNLGSIYVRKGRVDDAINLFNKALIKNPDDAGLHYKLGWANYKNGNLNIAERELEKALDLNADIAQWHNFLGVVYNQLQEPGKALNEFATAVKLKPAYANAHKNIGLIFLNNEEFKEAIFHLNETLKLEPEQKDSKKIRTLLKDLELEMNNQE